MILKKRVKRRDYFGKSLIDTLIDLPEDGIDWQKKSKFILSQGLLCGGWSLKAERPICKVIDQYYYVFTQYGIKSYRCIVHYFKKK